MIEKDGPSRLIMGRPRASASLALLMLTSLLCIVPPVAIAEGSDSADSKMTFAAIVAIIGLLIVFIAAARLFFMRPSEDELQWGALPPLDPFSPPVPDHNPPEPTVTTLPQMAAPVQEMIPQIPPLPEGGLPTGWTMEQWQHYGQEYLDKLPGHNNG